MADNTKQEFQWLDIPDGNGGFERKYVKDAEARAAIAELEPSSAALVVCTTSTLPATLSPNTYYNITDAVSTMTLHLPTVTDNNQVSVVAAYFTTNTGVPTVNITADSPATISYFTGYSIEASKSYELNIMWNGTKWIVAYATIG